MLTPRKLRRPTADKASTGRSRIRWSYVREAGISLLVIVIIAIGVVWSIPDSAIKQTASPALSPIARASGLDQSWRMFSPNPPRATSDLEVYVAMRNGDKRLWKFNGSRSVLRSFNWDRWRKLKEQVISEKTIRPGFAHWVVRQVTKPGEQPVRVWIVLQTETLPPPGADGPQKKERKLLYNQMLTGAR